jgi:hypothetical protein
MKQTLRDVKIVWGFCFISLVILNLFQDHSGLLVICKLITLQKICRNKFGMTYFIIKQKSGQFARFFKLNHLKTILIRY